MFSGGIDLAKKGSSSGTLNKFSIYWWSSLFCFVFDLYILRSCNLGYFCGCKHICVVVTGHNFSCMTVTYMGNGEEF